jgi:ankyrin repeat protein
VDSVKDRLRDGAYIEATDSEGDTALHWAARNGSKDIVQLLIEKRANLEAKNKLGARPLHVAAHHGHEDVLQQLLGDEHRAEIEAKDKGGCTPLYWASSFGHDTIVQTLLEDSHANIEAADNDGWTALHVAASKGHKKVVETLGRHKANIEALDNEKRTALYCAARRGRQDVVEVLLREFKAKIDARTKYGWTALHTAAANGHEGVVQFIVTRFNVDLEAKTDRKWTALFAAAVNGHEAIVSFLIKKKASIEAKTMSGNTAVHTACFNEKEAIAGLLLRSGASFTVKNEAGDTGLFLAVRFGFTDVVQKLLEDENMVELVKLEKTPKLSVLHEAIEKGHKEISLLLLQKGVIIPKKDSKGDTLLHCAARHGLADVIRYLLRERKVTKDYIIAENDDRETAIDYAAGGEYIDIVVDLLKSVNGPDEAEGSAWRLLHWAVYHASTDVVRLLVLKWADLAAKDSKERQSIMASAADLTTKSDYNRSPEETVAKLILLRPPPPIKLNPEIPILKMPDYPDGEMGKVCHKICPYIMDFYNQKGDGYSLERFNFPVDEVVYKYGPEAIMSPSARPKDDPLDKNDLLFRWIHLPANNVSHQESEMAEVETKRIQLESLG